MMVAVSGDKQYFYYATRRMRRRVTRISAILAVAGGGSAAGCCYLGISALRRAIISRNKHSLILLSRQQDTSAPSRLIDMLPKDLDVLNSSRVIGGLGVQLLLLGGFAKENGKWTRRDSGSAPDEDWLARITPTWKPGGQLNYSYDNADNNSDQISVFGDGLDAGTSVASLAETLEGMGIGPDAFDPLCKTAISTMLSWNLPKVLPEQEQLGKMNGDMTTLLLLVLSFDATPSCRNVEDCPLPGPSNEMLAATAARFVAKHRRRNQQNNNSIRIVAQWEVASALLQRRYRNDVPAEFVIPVGTPGKFENTVEILEQMRCQVAHDERTILLLAHPDHLRRVYHTAQTLWKRNNENKNNLRGNNKCAPSSRSYRLLAAMQPYTLDWPSQQQNRENERMARSSGDDHFNLFDSEATLVHTGGKEQLTNWYDPNHLGYFPDGDPQQWVHKRDIFLLYDHWAMAKGVASGII